MTQHIDDEGGSQVCVVTVATSPSPWDVPATTQTTGSNRGDFRHTQSDQGTDDTTHWGSKQKKEVTLFHRCLHCLSPPSLAQQNMTVQRPEYPWQHTAELSRQHIVTQIFQMIYCQAIDPCHCEVGQPLLNQITKRHVGVHFT